MLCRLRGRAYNTVQHLLIITFVYQNRTLARAFQSLLPNKEHVNAELLSKLQTKEYKDVRIDFHGKT